MSYLKFKFKAIKKNLGIGTSEIGAMRNLGRLGYYTFVQTYQYNQKTYKSPPTGLSSINEYWIPLVGKLYWRRV
jgi:hypothetical protein